jgi:hypothetical protein
VIRRRDLVRELERRRVADWAVQERQQEHAIIDDARGLRRAELRARLALVVHHDLPAGRGTARVEVGADEDRAGPLVDHALALAATALAPSWRGAPPAAPARVALADPAIAGAPDLAAAAAAALARVRRPAGAVVRASLHALREQVVVQTRAGLTARWSATAIRGAAIVSVSGRALHVARAARRLVDLELGRALAEAAADLALLARAAPAQPGPCAVVLGADALLHAMPAAPGAPALIDAADHGELGLWGVFAALAQSATERRGLARYRPGAPVAPGAERAPDALAIASDGALDFGLRSAPLGDEGDAVRRFALVEGGVCVGLGLTGREAALRGADPNGGVRNLVVAPGRWRGELPAGRSIEVRRLRALAIDPLTGEASVEIGLGLDHRDARGAPFTGGRLELDLVAALAGATRSAAVIRRGAYVGPAAVWIDEAQLEV